jgi:hypothetical protein
MRSLISVLEVKVGKKEADDAIEMLAKVPSTRQAEHSAAPCASIQAATKEDSMKEKTEMKDAKQTGAASGSVASPGASSEGSQRISISRSGSQPSSKGSPEYFTGSVRIDPLFKANDPLRASGGRVPAEGYKRKTGDCSNQTKKGPLRLTTRTGDAHAKH